MNGAALCLLAIGVACQFIWRAFPDGQQGDVWTASQAFLLLCSLGLNAYAYRQRELLAVFGLLAAWQMMTLGCNAVYLVAPWPIKQGEALCSDLLNLPLGAMSGIVALVLAWRLYVKGRDG